ncbi:MAG: pyruvate, phosphate dikinase, partial [Candidatus Komeilibacteria bacterium CG_4_9_14_0_8_um_filter_36_9]
MAKYFYAFREGNREMKNILGGKGANLAEMTLLNLPVPPGFTITSEACEFYLQDGNFFDGFDEELDKYLEEVEGKLGNKFGDETSPLLVSVRSGAAVSMPGMMDTILNLGLNDKTVLGLLEKTGNERFCYDAYRRFVNMFGNVVLGISHENFEEVMDKMKEEKGV